VNMRGVARFQEKFLSMTFDPIARAIYLRKSNEKVDHTVRKDDCLAIDYDKHNHIVGVEIIRVVRAEGVIKRLIHSVESYVPKSCRKEIEHLVTC
jgi:uncharacterized protein YuzE